ncbi:MAG: hypothetical protein CVU11_09240 [Bacteroidetes bacterium HGW-Bacteroidetes-6]|jgi:hypothetical protein|nr:MAG: hypothetical protein CVU11_09240 [Bacteroidetes bacterium HGW-Bacteroidetes-6]
MKLKSRYLPLVASLIIGAALLLFYLGNTIPKLNDVYFNAGGDGIKNYYTAEYHARYDSSVFYFEGMNYPEGDHVMFTDGFFPVVLLIKAIKPAVDVSPYTQGIINGIILLSFIVAVFFLYRVFEELKINKWVSAFAAPGLVFLSPQIMRIPGHYSLSLMFFLPLMIYLLIRFYKQKKWKYILWAGVTVFLCSLCHLYYFAMSGLLVGGFFLYLAIFDKQNMRFVQALKYFALAIVLPYALIFIIMYFSDSVSDRSTYPFGFLIYKSGWEGVFMKDSHSSFDFINQWFKPDQIEWEGWSFIGNAAVVVYFFVFGLFASIPFLFHSDFTLFIVIGIISVIIWLIFKRKQGLFNLTGNHAVNGLLWSGFIAMFVSFALPVSVFPDMYYHIGPVRELRGIGRMAWIFFYAINIGMLFFIHAKIKKDWLKYGLMIVAVLLIYLDMHKQCKVFLFSIKDSESVKTFKESIDNSPLNDPAFCSNYDAVLTVPAILVGSENVNVYSEDNADLMGFSFLASLKSGLPIVSSLMSRTSILQSVQKAEFFLGPYNKPSEYLAKLPAKGSFLVLSSPTQRELFAGEKIILDNSDSLWSDGRFILSSISFEKLRQLYAPIFPDFSDLTSVNPVFWTDFSDSIGEGYFTKGALSNLSLKNPVWIMDFTLQAPLDSSVTSEISFWYSNVFEDGLLRGSCEIAIQDSLGNNLVYDLQNLGRYANQIDNSWALYKRILDIPAGASKIQIALVHYELKINKISVDNILVRDTRYPFVVEDENWFMKNNYFYPKNK